MVIRIIFECTQLGILWNDIGSFNYKKNKSVKFKWYISNVLKYNDLLRIEKNQKIIWI